MTRVAIEDDDLVPFLQWALPRLGYRWAGFRKVRGQVKKRIGEILAERGLADLAAFREQLEEARQDDELWQALDAACYITISRFNRDRGVFEDLLEHVLVERAEIAAEQNRPLRVWSAGCASGEEPYTVVLLWHARGGDVDTDVQIEVLATDAAPHMIERARRGIYPAGCLRELPKNIVD